MNIHTTLTGLSLVVLTALMGPAAFAAEPPTSATPPVFLPAGDMALPSNAEAGKCYARAFENPTYRTETEEVLKRQAAERIELIPAQTEMVEEKVLVRAAFEQEEIIPAQFDTVTEEILVKPATTRWKKGRGLIEKVNNFTGEIMCLEDVPAEYKTITKQVITVPATTKLVQVPAEYKTVMVEKVIAPAKENRIPIPAQYQTVTKTVLASEGKMVWQEVLCETNAPELAKNKPAFTDIHTQSRSGSQASLSGQGKYGQGQGDWWSLWFNEGYGVEPRN